MTVTLRSNDLQVDLCPESGALIGLLSCQTGWHALRQPRLASAVRLLVPIPEHRNNRVLCHAQPPSSFEVADPSEARIGWRGVVGDKSGRLDIDVTLRIRVAGPEAHFTVALENRSAHVIEEVWCPCLGGLRAPDGEPPLESHAMHMCGGLTSSPLGDGFPNECGYWGTDHPTFLRVYPGPGAQAPLVILNSGEQGISLGIHDRQINVVSFVHELLPGYLDAKRRRVPLTDEIGGKQAGVCVSAVRLPFVQPGERVELAPAVIAVHTGDWHGGLEPHSRSRATWRSPVPRPAWMGEIDCWHTIQMTTPEGCVRFRYSELPDVAREAREHGVGAIQIIGWAMGGQDGDEPRQDFNPRLGSRDELAKAIQEVESLGVRALMMWKFKWADRTAAGFKRDFLPHALCDMWGQPTSFDGYAYQTQTQMLAGGSRRTGVGMCHLSPGYRERIVAEFDKILDLGASGVLVDELSNHMLLCFDTSHGHRWGESNFKGTQTLIELLHRRAQERGVDLLFTGEGPNDHQSQVFAVNYLRTWDGSNHGEPIHRPAWKFMDPGMHFASCITGWDDREMINQCIAHGYIIDFEPHHFKGRLSDFPDTLQYGKRAAELRRGLRDFLFDGVYRDTVGVDLVTETGPAAWLCTLFERRSDARRAVVVVNHQTSEPLRGHVALPQSSGRFDMHRIESAEIGRGGPGITVPPRSLVVLVERE